VPHTAGITAPRTRREPLLDCSARVTVGWPRITRRSVSRASGSREAERSHERTPRPH
jgi:hypothetical protein